MLLQNIPPLLLFTATAHATLFTKCFEFEDPIGDNFPVIRIHPVFTSSLIGFYSLNDPTIASPEVSTDLELLQINYGAFRLCSRHWSQSTGCELGTFIPVKHPMMKGPVIEEVLNPGNEFQIEIIEKGLYCIGLYSKEAISDCDFGVKTQHTFGYLTFPEQALFKIRQLTIMIHAVGLLAFWWTGIGENYRSLLLIISTTSLFSQCVHVYLINYTAETGDKSSHWYRTLNLICLLTDLIDFTSSTLCTYGISSARPRVVSFKSLPRLSRWLLYFFLLGTLIQCLCFGLDDILPPKGFGYFLISSIPLFMSIALWSCTHSLRMSKVSGGIDPRLNRTRLALLFTGLVLCLWAYLIWSVLLCLDVYFLRRDSQLEVSLKNSTLQALLDIIKMVTGIRGYISNFVLYRPAAIMLLLLWIWSKPQPAGKRKEEHLVTEG